MVSRKQHVLWLYRQDRKVVPRGADAVACVDDFNTDAEFIGKESMAEELYTKIETAATPVLEKLRSGDHRLSDEEKGTLSYFVGYQKFRTTLLRDTVNSAAIDGFRQTCQKILDENRAHEYVGTTEAERSGEVKFTIEDAAKMLREIADGTTELEQSGKGWAIQGAIEGGHMLSPKIYAMHWTLCESPISDCFVTTDNPVALFEPLAAPGKPGYGPSLQFMWPVSPKFMLFGDSMLSGGDERVRIPGQNVRMFVDELLRIAHREVYASFCSKELQTRMNRILKDRDPLIVRMPANYRG
jgi:hypothetical protein